MSGPFHPNSDADRLYFCRRDGGRGIRAIRTMYESRIISIGQHLRNIKDKSETHEYFYESEANNIVRVGYELLQRSEIEDNINKKPRTISKKFSTTEQKERNIAVKKSIVTFTANSKATVKLTRTSVADAQLTKV